MRKVNAKKISDTVSELCIRANTALRSDVLAALKSAYRKEKNKRAKSLLAAIIKNAAVAKNDKLAICQDTGLASVFVELGHDVHIAGDLRRAVNKGVEAGYRKGFLRNSVIDDPLNRKAPHFKHSLIHLDLVKGAKIKITVLPKGFGCENKTQLKMFKPTAELSEIKKFIIEAVRAAGPDACPPYVVGVGIGGSADYAVLLAKKALLKKLNAKRSRFELELLSEINKLNIGPMGLGGKITALALKIEKYPTHIAGLPVAVNISCHALRSATAVI